MKYGEILGLQIQLKGGRGLTFQYFLENKLLAHDKNLYFFHSKDVFIEREREGIKKKPIEDCINVVPQSKFAYEHLKIGSYTAICIK